jgi:hypothetical protein
MLAAMEKNPFVVMGSQHRDIDYERVWRNELEKRMGRKLLQSTGVTNSRSLAFLTFYRSMSELLLSNSSDSLSGCFECNGCLLPLMAWCQSTAAQHHDQ